jgi:hypothetical protein
MNLGNWIKIMSIHGGQLMLVKYLYTHLLDTVRKPAHQNSGINIFWTSLLNILSDLVSYMNHLHVNLIIILKLNTQRVLFSKFRFVETLLWCSRTGKYWSSLTCNKQMLIVSTQSVWCLTTDWTIGFRSPVEARDFSFSLCVQTGSGAHPPSCPMGTGGLFPRE